MSAKLPDKRSRLNFITWMQMFGCVFVIIGHSYPFVTEIPSWVKNFQVFIYDFHMPLFVWCSGYLLVAAKQTGKYSFSEYAKRRAFHILLPYVFFSLIGIIPKILLSGLLNDALSFDLVQIVRAFLVPRESIWGHFWFLPMIYILGLIGYEVVQTTQKSGGLSIITILLGMVGYFAPTLTGWFALNDVVHYAIYLFIGIACAKWIPSLLNTKHIWHGIVTLLASIALFILLPHGKIVSFAISLCMLIAILLFSLLLNEKCAVDRSAVYAQTYSIYILSWPCQLVVEIILERFLKLPFTVVFPAMLIIGLTIPLVIIYVVDLFEKKTKTTIISKMIGR